MGGASSKKRGKPRTQTSSENQGSPTFEQYVPDPNDYYIHPSWQESSSASQDTHEYYTTEYGTEDINSGRARTPPPPYSKFDLFAPRNVSRQHSATAGFARHGSIPNLMDLDPYDMDDVLQERGIQENTSAAASANWDAVDFGMMGSAASSSGGDSSSSNQNISQVKKDFKKSSKSSSGKKPSGMSKKSFCKSVPDLAQAMSEFQPPEGNSRKGARRRNKPGNNRVPGVKSKVSNGPGNMRVMSLEKLQALSKMNDREVLFTLSNFSTGFVALLNELDYSDEVLVLVLDVLAKACTNEDCPNTANALLQTVLYTKLFNVRMVTYLQNAPYDGTLEEDPTVLRNLLVVFTTVLREFKKEAESKLGQCLHLGRQAINQLIGPSGDLDDDMIRELRVLTDVQKANKERFPAATVASVDAFPGVFHIDHQPLSEIKIKNDFDYKIHQFQIIQNEFNDTLKFLFGETNIYRDVHVIDTECSTSHGLTYKLSFDTRDHQEVSWNKTAKLLEGSIVLVTSSSRSDLHCATIVKRIPEELSVGHVWVKLLDRRSTIFNSSLPLMMSENFTYKDDLISVMESLQLQKGHPMPFTSLIVGLKKKLTYPRYLTPNSSITLPFCADTSNDAKNKFSALNTGMWPDASTLNFDHTFYDALKHALTKELALIHCPPGSDSIGFGHCVSQMLLHNEALWHTSHSPIMVLYPSDDTLDNFLLRVFSKAAPGKVIRIGGHSKHGDLLGYELEQSRTILYNTEMIPLYVASKRRTLHDKMMKLKMEISSLKLLLEKTEVQLLKVESLKSHIWDIHYDQLKLQENATEDPFLMWLLGSFCSPYELQLLLNEYSLLEPEIREKMTDVSWSTPKNQNLTCEELLTKLEIDRRVLTSETNDFDDLERKFSKRPAVVSGLDIFISVTSLKKDPIGLIQGKKANFLDVIGYELKKTDVMKRDVVNSVMDVLSMKLTDRWDLYRFWREEFVSRTKEEIKKKEEKYEKFYLQLQEVVREIDVSILQHTKLLGITLAAAAKHHHLLKIVAPRIVIVLEAGRIPECKLVASLTDHCQHLIMIGDHHQVKPSNNKFCCGNNSNHVITDSLFGKLMAKGIKFAQLTNNSQMSSSIVEMLATLFNDWPIKELHTSLQSKINIKGFASNIFFMNSSNLETSPNSLIGGHTNEFEAKCLVILFKYLVKQGYKHSQITILATSLAQVQLLINLFKIHGLNQVECFEVEDFVENTNDIVLLSLVRSNNTNDIGLLSDESYVYMAISRARLGLYCIGNIKMLMNSTDLWKDYVIYLAHHQMYGSNLILKCERHPNEMISVNTCKAFKNAIKGFCKQQCSVVLSCGHLCNKPCHGDDVKHNTVKCNLPCMKTICPAGHKCPKKCFEKCPPCMYVVKKVKSCSHVSTIKCSMSQIDSSCSEKCEKLLACRHPCPKKCGEKCDDRDCGEVVEYHNSPCKHTFFIKCSQRVEENLKKYCPMPCLKKLACGHTCSGTCGKCNGGLMHVPCLEKCNLPLICGHRCQNLCGSDCTPCKEKCGYSCDHTNCSSDCGSFCIPCCDPCAWQCMHQKCSKMCFEVCDRQPCNYPCPRLLPCRHRCIGFCGESCPSICRICNRTELLGYISDPKLLDSSRFVLLEDCNHILEVSAMGALMQNQVDIKVMTCPKCGTPIRKSLRYGNMIKKTMADVARIISMYQKEISGSVPAIQKVKTLINLLPENSYVNAVSQMKAEALECLSARDAIVLEDKYRFLQIMFVLWKTLSQLDAIARFDAHQRLLILEHLHMELTLTRGQAAIRSFVRELKRVIYLVHLHKTSRSIPSQSSIAKLLYGSLLKRLSDLNPFEADDELKVVNEMKAFQKNCSSPQARVEDLAKFQVSSIWQMSAGHWSKDENGQYYYKN